MSTTAPHQPTTTPFVDQLDRGGGTRRPRRRVVVTVGVLALVGAALALVVVNPIAGSRGTPGGLADNADPTSVTSVSQGDISSQTQVSGTLGYSGTYTVVNQAQGTVTSLPAIGQVVSEGQVLYDVSGNPVLLLYGTTPAYRTLSEGATDAATSGADVGNLNYDLVALGYLSSADIASEPDDFTAYTKAAVEKLQAALGVTQDGVLSLGQVVFLPSAARITAVGQNTVVGGLAQPGSQILTATSTTRVVTIDLNADQQGDVAVGDKVTITLPNSQTTPGTVTSVGTVATTPSGSGSGNSTPTVTVLVKPDNPTATGSLDQAPVEVSITAASAKNAFIVPLDALLPLAGGGYALEVIGAKGVHSLEPVTLGLFDDGNEQVQVSGPGVHAGQRIVIPA
jgi:Putative peptidoglycan binding domain